MGEKRVLMGIASIFLIIVGFWGGFLATDILSSDSKDTAVPETQAPTLTPSVLPPSPAAAVSAQAANDPLTSYKRTITLLVEDVINDQNTDILDQIFAPDYVGHLPASQTDRPTLEYADYAELPVLLHTAVPDIRVTPEIMIGEGNMIALRAVLRGTFESEFYDIPPTRAALEITYTTIYRFNEDGKIAEEWISYDTVDLARQFGLVTTDGSY